MASMGMDTTPNTSPPRSRWIVMWNLPGCLPEMEPMTFDSWKEAREALVSELENLDESCEDADEDRAVEAREATLSLGQALYGTDWCGDADGYVYSLTEAPPPDPRIQALAKHLGEDPDEVQKASYGENTYEFVWQEWLVLTDEEADEKAEEYIRDSVWAFNASWIADYTPNGIDEYTVKAVQGARGKDVNAPLTALIEAGRGMDKFVDDAIRADGRGHFLSSYDSDEHESEGYFLYRVN